MRHHSNSLTEKKDSGFKKEISLFGGVSIIGGIMVGSGIYYLGSYVLIRTGMRLGLALLSWILGGIVSLLGGNGIDVWCLKRLYLGFSKNVLCYE